jgi:hypothetical protein
MITAQAADGSSVRAFDEGRGPVVLILHGGMDDGTSWRRVAARLVARARRRKSDPTTTIGWPLARTSAVTCSTSSAIVHTDPTVPGGTAAPLEALVAPPVRFVGRIQNGRESEVGIARHELASLDRCRVALIQRCGEVGRVIFDGALVPCRKSVDLMTTSLSRRPRDTARRPPVPTRSGHNGKHGFGSPTNPHAWAVTDDRLCCAGMYEGVIPFARHPRSVGRGAQVGRSGGSISGVEVNQPTNV